MKGLNTRNRLRSLLSTFCVAFAAALSSAYSQTITDLNASLNVNPTTQSGMNNWTVDGHNYLQQQWFWYSVGNSAPSSIDTLALSGDTLVGNVLTTSYLGAGFTLGVSYTLTGSTPGSGQSTLGVNITVQNTSGGSLTNFQFYEYSHFLFSNPNNVALGKFGGLYDEAFQTGGNGSIMETNDVNIVPGSTYGEANTNGVPGNTLSKLNGGAYVNLNNNNNAGPADVTWAFEWQKTLAASGSGSQLEISKVEDLTVVPEPSVLALLALGAAGSAFRWSRKSKTA
jgi:hypothetical protein